MFSLRTTNVFFSHVDGHRLWTGRHVRHTLAALASIRLVVFVLLHFNLSSFLIVISPHILPSILVFSFCAPSPLPSTSSSFRWRTWRTARTVFHSDPRSPRPPTQRHPSARDPLPTHRWRPELYRFTQPLRNESLWFTFLFIYNPLNRYYSPHDGYVNNIFLHAVQTRWKRVFKHALGAGFIVHTKMYDQVLQRSNSINIITSTVIISVVFPTIYRVITMKMTNIFLHTAYLIIKHLALLMFY